MTTPNELDLAGSWLEIGMVIAAVGAGAITMLLPYLKNKFRKCDNGKAAYPKNFQWEIHTRLHEILTELRIKTDSARTQIVQFHNGGTFLDGVSMKKFSVTHESLNIGTSGEGDTKRDLLISMFLDKLNIVTKNEPKLHITSKLEDSYSKQYMKNSNIMAFSILPIRRKNEILGYVMVQWCSLGKVDEIDETTLSEQLVYTRDCIEIYLQQHKQNYK
jgi:hypothetical protein